MASSSPLCVETLDSSCSPTQLCSHVVAYGSPPLAFSLMCFIILTVARPTVATATFLGTGSTSFDVRIAGCEFLLQLLQLGGSRGNDLVLLVHSGRKFLGLSWAL
eukprot:6491288-Amphidinium_carterae.1